MRPQNPAQRGCGHHHLWHSGLKKFWSHEVLPVQPYSVRHRSHIRCIKEEGCSQKSLHQILGILHRRCATFSGVRVFQDVDQGGQLLTLEEIDYRHHVEEEPEAGVLKALPISRSAYTLALPACPKQVHWPMIGDQINKKGGAALIDVLG